MTVEKIRLRGIAQGDQNIMQKLEHAKCFVSRMHISDTSGDREEALSALCALMIFFLPQCLQSNSFCHWEDNLYGNTYLSADRGSLRGYSHLSAK